MKYFPKKLTMTWIRNSYKEGSLTPEELAGEIVRRAEKYRDYNIWIVAPDLKRMMDYIEKLPKDMESLPLWGIPFAVKDNIDVAGSPTTAACPDYAYDPEEDAAVVKKLIEAGVDNGEFICEDCEGTARNIMFVLEGLKISAQTIGVTAEAVDREILYLLRGLGVED